MSDDFIGFSGTSPAAASFLHRLRQAGQDVRPVGAQTGRLGPQGDGPEVLFLMPRDIEECEALLFDLDQFARQGWVRLIILCATLSPRYTRALRARVPADIALVDAPYIGAPRQIETGQPSFLLGGDGPALDRAQPLFALLGHSVTRMGGFGTAMAAKVLQDCLAAATSAMTRSALDWAEAQGIEEPRLVSLLEEFFGARLPRPVSDPAGLVTNALPGDKAGSTLVKKVESAIDGALADVHLTPPRHYSRTTGTHRARHLH